MATKVANGDIKSLDLQAIRQGQKDAVTSLTTMYIVVAAVVVSAWGLGVYGFSSLWIFMLISCLFVIWKTKISRIIKKQLDYEEATLHRKRALRQSETVEWLNFLLNRWWVFSSSTIEDLFKKRLDDRLLAIKPSFLQSLVLRTFDVGEQTPHIRNVRVFEFSEGVPGGHKPCTWVNVNHPPKGLDSMSNFQVVVETDLTMQCEDFKMIFVGRVGSKRVNVNFDMVVQDLMLSGTMQAIVQFSMDVPFPHISKATVCFLEKPEVTFNISVMGVVQMMEVPLLKSWIHTNVMEGLTKAMVDPYSVDIPIAKTGPIQISRGKPRENRAEGVLTIQMKGTPQEKAAADEIRYSVVRVAENKRETMEVPASEEWKDVCSFFVYSLANEKLQIKNKCKRLLTSTVLEKHEFSLSSFPFKIREFAEKEIDNKDGSKLSLKMQFTPLPEINLEPAAEIKKQKNPEVAGVMYICIHGAVNLLAADKSGASDPYCVLFCDRRRVLTTPYVPHTRSPRWESWVEFFVSDYTKSALSFFVFDWDGTNVIDDDFLGSTHLQLSVDERSIVKKTLTLGYNKPSEGYVVDKSCGMVTVSVVFRPVASVAKSEKFRSLTESINSTNFLYKEDMVSPASVNMAYLRLPSRDDEQARASTSASAYIEEYLEGKTIVELTILQAKDVVPMDRNGYSDPFCVVLNKGKKVFTTGIKKKTLFPKWNETVTTEMDGDDAILCIEMYDNDMIGKDFMGKLPLTTQKLKELSIKGMSEWFPLQRTKSGKIQLKCTVTCKDNMKGGNKSENVTDDVFDSPTESPVKPVLPKMVVDDAYLNSVHLPSNTVVASSPNDKRLSLTPTSIPSAQIRRSHSDLAVNRLQGRRGTQMINMSRKESMTLQRSSSPVKRSGSSNSLAVMQKSPGDNISLKSDPPDHDTTFDSSIMGDKIYSVTGKIIQARGLDRVSGEFYCKVRVEHHSRSSRINLFSHNTRVIAKSGMVNASDPDINLNFEIDRGHGVSCDDILIIDMKQSSKAHLATKGFTLRELLADADASGILQWLPLENDVEVEISLSTGAPSPHHQRRSARILKSLSFRKDK